MANNIVGGKVFIEVGGRRILVKGNVKYSLGSDKREAVVGADGVHGVKSMPQAPYVEFSTTDTADLDIAAIQGLVNTTVTVEKPNGKLVVFSQAWHEGEGDAQTEEGEVSLRFGAMKAEEVRS